MVPETSNDMREVKAIAYEWLRRLNESGYEGLIPDLQAVNLVS
ncbi:MAG: hypothetical protein ACYCR2_10975 [Thermoplasmataceae archaeon]